MEVKILSFAEIENLNIGVAEIIDAVETGFKLKGEGKVELPPKIGIYPRGDCHIHAMPCHVGGQLDVAGIKWVSGYSTNREKGLPYISGVICLNDAETGFVKAVMDANWITAWRTGAATGVCAKHMADPEAETIAIIGLGVQGRTNTVALANVLKHLKRVQAFDIHSSQTEKYKNFIEETIEGIEVIPCATAEEAVRGADVIVTCTAIVENPDRFISVDWLKENSLSIALDYDSSYEAAVMAHAGAFVCDDTNQYLLTRNQGVHFQRGYPGTGQILGDLGELCAGKFQLPARGNRAAVLMGIASHDVLTADLVYRKAETEGIGTLVQI